MMYMYANRRAHYRDAVSERVRGILKYIRLVYIMLYETSVRNNNYII